MEIKRCEKGHFYDAEANATCPQCAAEAAYGAGPSGMETAPVNFGVPADYGKTEPVGGGANVGATMPLDGGSGFTEGYFGNGGGSAVEDYDGVTEPVIVNDISGFSPVVGWLVCIDGPSRGMDYRIQAGYNYIGRGEHMDVCIKGDMKISRDRHAQLAYDQQERVFFFGPANGKDIIRINGKMVMTPQEIVAYDILTIGSTKLMFVPLCGERFDWNE